MEFTHHTIPDAYTCNASANARILDYLFHDPILRASPYPLPKVENDTPLPGPDQPSDHVAVLASFEWQEEN